MFIKFRGYTRGRVVDALFVKFWIVIEGIGGNGENIKMVPFCFVTSRSLNVCV